jgi:hypothetical protein
MKKYAKEIESNLGKDGKRFFKLFTQSTFEGSQAATRKMKKIAARSTRHIWKALLFQSLHLLLYTESEKLLWPNCPLLVLLQFFDPNMLSGSDHDENIITLLVHLACPLVNPIRSDYSTQENQLTLGRQLIEHGANVDAVSFPNSDTPLHSACHSTTTTNLDFIQLLLENGADPDIQDHLGRTPLMYTMSWAPGAAKFLLEWPTTDVNIIDRSGFSFLAKVRGVVEYFSDQVALPDNPDKVKDRFVLQQWREIEEMLLERVGQDTGITAVE